jgi:hypothetical protein
LSKAKPKADEAGATGSVGPRPGSVAAGQPPAELPQLAETWQGDFGNVGDQEHPLWVAWITCPEHDLILAYSASEADPNPEWFWDTVVWAIRQPRSRQPHRPTRLLVRHARPWAALRSRLKALGITLGTAKEMNPVDGVPELIDHLYIEWTRKHKRQSQGRMHRSAGQASVRDRRAD